MKLNHKILGRAKATTVHNMEQEGLARPFGIFGSRALTGNFPLKQIVIPFARGEVHAVRVAPA